MNNITKTAVLGALSVLKALCRGKKDCNNCPLLSYDWEGKTCYLDRYETVPADWDLQELEEHMKINSKRKKD